MFNKFKKWVPQRTKWFIKKNINKTRSIGKPKIFGIGLNKTGTTSLKAAMNEMGFIVGLQQPAELLMVDWAERDFRRIVKYCKTAQFFQDAPFSKPYTYVVLDYEFPNSKFILTVRDSPEQWYNSLTKFHANKWGNNNHIPTKKDLKKASYIYKGWAWKMNRISYNTPEHEPYKKDILIKFYKNYNHSVKEYFHYKSDDLLVINVGEDGAYQKLCNFLGVESDRDEFPWENKTKEVK